MDQPDELRLSDYAQALRRWVLVIVACAVVGAVLGALVATKSAGDQKARIDIDLVEEVALAGEAADAPPLATDVAAQMKQRLDRYTGDISSEISVSGVVGSALVEVRSTGSNEATASTDGITVAERFVQERREERRAEFAQAAEYHRSRIAPLQQQVEELNAQLSDLAASGGDTLGLQTQLIQSLSTLIFHQEQAAEAEYRSTTANASLADPVLASTEAGSVDVLVGLLIGGLAGALIGVVIVFVRTHLDRRLRTRRQVERVVPDAAVIDIVPAGAGAADVAPLARGLVRAARASGSPSVDVVSADHSLTAAAEFTRLLHDAFELIDSADGNPGVGLRLVEGGAATPPAGEPPTPAAPSLLIARAGRTADHQLARCAADLRLAGVDIIGVVLTDVPRRELAWAFDHATPSASPVP